MICLYCNGNITTYYCKSCKIQYFIIGSNAKDPFYEIIFHRPDLIYAKCYVNSGIAIIYCWRSHPSLALDGYEEIFKINNWKWASLSPNELLKMIKSIMMFL